METIIILILALAVVILAALVLKRPAPMSAPPTYEIPPWPPYMDQDATTFGEQLDALYAGSHGTHVGGPVDYLGWVRWGSEYRYRRANGLTHAAAWSEVEGMILDIWDAVAPPTPGPASVRLLRGFTRTYGPSFGDDSGPRIVHGCSDFAALVKYHEDPDKMRRQLDVVMQHQQYVRILWRLNGWYWGGGNGYPSSGLTVDPIRDPWFESALLGYLTECTARGIRVNLSTGDLYNWTDEQAEYWFFRVAEIAASVHPHTVWLQAAANEMRGTMPGGETDENIQRCAELIELARDIYPWNHCAISDPGTMDKAGMERMSPTPANAALIHNLRWMSDQDRDITHAIRRAFNIRYEGHPGLPIVEDEPTGPNGSVPKPFGQNVYQPFQNPDDLFALYTQHVLVGSASNYFSDASLVSREPLDSTWGFKELPALWRRMEIPEDIGQGTMKPGHHGDAPIRIGTGADRADSVVTPDGRVAFGIIHGGKDWHVPSGWSADVTYYDAARGPYASKRVAPGDPIITTSGHRAPLVVRLVRV